jgi:hypothetical protein
MAEMMDLLEGSVIKLRSLSIAKSRSPQSKWKWQQRFSDNAREVVDNDESAIVSRQDRCTKHAPFTWYGCTPAVVRMYFG